MTLLDFARGPAMFWAMTLMVIGIVWRLAGAVLLARRKDRSTPRGDNRIVAGLRAVAMRSVPPHELEKNITFQHITGYAWHLGWFATFLFFVPHIPFLKSILGFGWPGLPNQAIVILAAITLAILLDPGAAGSEATPTAAPAAAAAATVPTVPQRATDSAS